MGAAISENGVLMHIPIIGPYNTERLVTSLDTLYRDRRPEQERAQIGDEHDENASGAILNHNKSEGHGLSSLRAAGLDLEHV